MEGCWRWLCWVGSGECGESACKLRVVEKLVEVCVIRGVRWYDVVGVVRRCGNEEEE